MSRSEGFTSSTKGYSQSLRDSSCLLLSHLIISKQEKQKEREMGVNLANCEQGHNQQVFPRCPE